MATKNKKSRFITEDEEKQLGESLRKAFVSSNPSPTRDGCPDSKLIRDLAFHKKIADPNLFAKATAHISECSECARDALVYAAEYKKRGNK